MSALAAIPHSCLARSCYAAAGPRWFARVGGREGDLDMADSTIVGKVHSLFRYPVKSMAGEALQQVQVSRTLQHLSRKRIN